jgi:hypothetical protein
MSVKSLIKHNQRLLLFRRQCKAALQSGRGRIYSGQTDLTQQTIGMYSRYIRDLLGANAMLRSHLRHA